MTTAFVDTQAWYSFFNSRDPAHARTKAAIAEFEDLVTTSFVFAEILSLLGRRLGQSAAIRVGTLLRSSRELRMIHPDEGQLARGWRRFLEQPDKTYSLVDCLSFVVMEELGIETAITGDRHFRQEGFRVLPQPE